MKILVGVVVCLVTLQIIPTWAKKSKPVVVNAETIKELADTYVLLATLGARLDSATITIVERYELLDALAVIPGLLDKVYCGEGKKWADYCRKKKKIKQSPVYDLENSTIETSVGNVTLTEIFSKHQQVNTTLLKPFSSCSVGRIQVYAQQVHEEWEPLQTRWLVYGSRNPPWPFAAASCEEAGKISSNLPENMEDAIEVIRDERCSGTNTLVMHASSWNIEWNDNGYYEKNVEADCWLDEEHRFSSEDKAYFSSETSRRQTPTSETWGYRPTLSNSCPSGSFVCEQLKGP